MHRISLAIVLFIAFGSNVLAFSQDDLSRLKQSGSCFGCDLRGANLRWHDLYKTNMSNSDLRGVKLRGALMANSRFMRSNMRGAELRRTRMRWAYLGGADLRGANLEEADLVAATMPFVDLRGAVLIDADLGSARLHRARMHNTILRGALLYNAKMRTVIGLTQEQLDQACGDESTQLPPGLRVEPCPAKPYKLPYDRKK